MTKKIDRQTDRQIDRQTETVVYLEDALVNKVASVGRRERHFAKTVHFPIQSLHENLQMSFGKAESLRSWSDFDEVLSDLIEVGLGVRFRGIGGDETRAPIQRRRRRRSSVEGRKCRSSGFADDARRRRPISN